MSRHLIRQLALLVVVTLAVAVGGAGVAAAFPTGAQFDYDALTKDGAGGVAFTGAQRWAGHECSVCHQDGPHLMRLSLESSHPEVFTTGYTPLMTYKFRVVMVGQTKAADRQSAGDNCGDNTTPVSRCDTNGFSLEFDDLGGKAVGTLAPTNVVGACGGTASSDPDVRVLTDGSAVQHSGNHFGQVAWEFCWTAPAAGFGELTAYLAAVDGNGGLGTDAVPADTTGDDTFYGAVPLPQAGQDAIVTQLGGCAASDSSSNQVGGMLAMAGVVGLLVMRRRRGAGAMLMLMLVVSTALSGCAHVQAHQREILAKKKMQFSPDPAEDELDLHMQEAREGSAGGYGSAGGGCGCN